MSGGRRKGDGSGGQKVEEAAQEERRMMAIMRQIEDMEHKAQGPRGEVKDARSSKTRGGHKGGAGGEKLENKRKKEANHTQDRRHGVLLVTAS